MDEGRGFTLSHQRVVLDVDFSGVITASAVLTIQPTNPALRTVYLHASPLLRIHNVTLSSPTPTEPLLPTPVSYALHQPFQPLPSREPPIDIRSHPEIKRKTWSAINERDEGELAISVTGGWIRLIEGDTALAPIEVHIDYRLIAGGGVIDGIVFDGDCVHLAPTAHDSARIWTPCVDNLYERCTWELEFIVPAVINETPVMVVSSGELLEQTTHPHSPSKTIFYYLQTTPTTVQHIGFAAGPFETHVIAESPKPILGFCLPEDYDLLVNTTSHFAPAMSYFSTEFGSYPFSEFKLVFLPNTRTSVTTTATMSILSANLLYPPDVIDQAPETRHILSLALVQQWIGINVIQRTLADTWLIHGLALYLNAQYLRHTLGNNEYRFRLKKDIQRCVRLDQGDQWPICIPGSLDPPDINFINLKAPLVLHILDRYLTKAGTSLGLSRVIPRIFLASLSDELPGNALSTQFFFKTCRKVSGLDLSSFQDQWVFGSGCPHFRISTNFIRKKFIVELFMNQTVLAKGKRAVPLFEGSLTVRIHEADGAPFEHVVDIKNAEKTYSLPFNTKYKRTRRSGHVAARFRKLQEDLAAEDMEDAQPKTSDTFAYPPWDDETERQRWRVAEWTDEQVVTMMGEGGGYEWIRIDPDCEWIASFDFNERPWYWISQLQSDRDVAAQLEAIQNMAHHPSPVVASELAKTVLVSNYFYRVRMEAAQALVNFSNAESEYIGLFYLLKIFQTLYCRDDSDPLEARFLPVKNDFSDFAAYFLQKTIITTLSNLRDPTSRTSWRSVRRLLLNILHSNDNTANPYTDGHYLATVISSIGNAFGWIDRNDEADQALLRDATDAIQRIVTMDRLVPSYRNIITQAGLKTQLKLIMTGQLTNDARMFLGYTREGNNEDLRAIALDCLLIARPPGRTPALLPYLVDLVKLDASLPIRRHVAKGLSEAILTSLCLGDVEGSAPSGVLDVTNDSAQARKERTEAHSGSIVKALRKEFGRRADLSAAIESALLPSFAGSDHDLRFSLLKLAEITTSSTQEPLPGSIITISTPVVETPLASTPKIRLNLAQKEDYGFPEVKMVIPPVQAKKKVHKSQKSGLSDADRLLILRALQKLEAHRASFFFRQPVDPVRDNAPNYTAIVKKPMDLSTIQAKLDAGHYASRQDFVEDVRLIISNCLLYNDPGTEVYRAGQLFEGVFHKVWNKMESTLLHSAQTQASQEEKATDSKASAPAPPPTGVKLKVKPPKSVTIDANPVALVPPMAPPPLPASRKPPVESKKRKTQKNDLDDMLGAEVDAIERKHQPDSFDQLLEPKPKKLKLPRPEPGAHAAPVELQKPAPPPESTPALPPVISYVPPQPPSDLPPTKANTTSFKHKRARALVQTLIKDENSLFFRRPVDPVVDGCPTYLDEIKQPMDLGTIAKKIDEKRYRTMGQLASDIDLVFSNCRQFNNPGFGVVEAADALQRVFWREWPKAVSSRMTPSERRDMSVLLGKALKDPIGWMFYVAVDPVELNIPTYFDIIPPEEARDLTLIKRKLDKGEYSTARQVDEDIELMLENARVFNGEGPVTDAANAFGRWWQAQRARME